MKIPPKEETTMSVAEQSPLTKTYLKQHNFYNESDISNSVCREMILSYHPDALEPILFRHYQHSTPKNANRPLEQSGRISCILFFYLQGDLHFVTPTHLYQMQYGDVFLAREGEPFCGRNMSDTYVEYYEINVPRSFFELVADPDFFGRLFYRREIDSGNYISMTDALKTRCIHKLQQLEALLTEDAKQNAMPAYACFIQIMQILNQSGPVLPENSLATKSSPCIFRAMEYIHSHLAALESIDEVAAYCYVSTSYLCRSFRTVMGSTVNDYIQSLRISHAKYLLQNGYNVSNACKESGFRTYSYFIQVFRKHVGMTPLQYAKTDYPK